LTPPTLSGILKDSIGWFIGDLEAAPEEMAPRPVVASQSMLTDRSGVYLQAQGLDGVEIARILLADMVDMNSTNLTNATAGKTPVPQWLLDMAPKLDAAVIVPTDVGTFGPSLAVEMRLEKLIIVPGLAELHNISLRGELDKGIWSLSIDTAGFIALPSLASNESVLTPIAVTGEWILGSKASLTGDVFLNWHPFGVPWMMVDKAGFHMEIERGAVKKLVLTGTGSFECSPSPPSAPPVPPSPPQVPPSPVSVEPSRPSLNLDIPQCTAPPYAVSNWKWTACAPVNNWDVTALAQHDVRCPVGQALGAFTWEHTDNGVCHGYGEVRGKYKYTCKKLDGAVLGSVTTRYGACSQNDQQNLQYLDRQNPTCNWGEVLTGFQLLTGKYWTL
jgi:hypothetical protein